MAALPFQLKSDKENVGDVFNAPHKTLSLHSGFLLPQKLDTCDHKLMLSLPLMTWEKKWKWNLFLLIFKQIVLGLEYCILTNAPGSHTLLISSDYAVFLVKLMAPPYNN